MHQLTTVNGYYDATAMPLAAYAVCLSDAPPSAKAALFRAPPWALAVMHKGSAAAQGHRVTNDRLRATRGLGGEPRYQVILRRGRVLRMYKSLDLHYGNDRNAELSRWSPRDNRAARLRTTTPRQDKMPGSSPTPTIKQATPPCRPDYGDREPLWRGAARELRRGVRAEGGPGSRSGSKGGPRGQGLRAPGQGRSSDLVWI